MKILNLHLIAFGPFTDLDLDFTGNQTDMRIIYGPNEAGKSSALRALTGWLFGIEHNSPDNFIHDYQQLKIGGTLRNSAGQELAFMRRKGRTNTVLTPEGEPMDDDILRNHLHRIDRQVFLSMFCIDHQALVSGGEDILKGGGELGQSLFAAGLGTADLRGVIQELENKSRSLFLPRGQLQVINQAISEYAVHKKMVSDHSLRSRDWIEKDQALRDHRLQLDKISGELGDISAEKHRLERLNQVIPKIAKRDALILRQKNLGSVVLLNPEFTETRKEAVRKLKSAQESLERATSEKKGLEEELDGLSVPQELLNQAQTITALHQILGAYQKGAQDLPGLKGTARQLQADAKLLLADLYPGLAIEDADGRRLSAAQRTQIQSLTGQHQALIVRVAEAVKRVDKAESTLEETIKKRDAIMDPGDPRNLKQAVERAKSQGKMEEGYRKVKMELNKTTQQAQVDLKKLGLWSGLLEDLETLAIPGDETVERYETVMQGLNTGLSGVTDKANEHQASLREIARQLAELQLTGEVPSEAELASARERRDYGWKLLRLEWLDRQDITAEKRSYDSDHALPDAFEKSVVTSDLVADRLRRESKRVATQAALVAEQVKLEKNLEQLEDQKTNLQEQLDQVQEEWRELWSATDIVPLSPKEMRSWIIRHRELVHMAETVRNLRLEAGGLEDLIAAHRAELGGELIHLVEPEPMPMETLEKLLQLCQKVVEMVEGKNRYKQELQQKITEIREEIEEANQEKVQAQRDLENWQANWSKAIQPLDLPGETIPAAVHVVIAKLDELFQKLHEAASLQTRIEGINQDARRFTEDVTALVKQLDSALLIIPPAQAAAELQARLSQAKVDAATETALRKQIKEKQGIIQASQDTIHLRTESLAKLCQQAGCEKHDELEAREGLSNQYQNLQKEIDDLEEQVLELAPGATMEEIRREAAKVNPDELPEAITELGRQIQELGQKRLDLAGEIARSEKELELMDDNSRAADAAEKVQGIASFIREGVGQYLCLRMASVILRREIERYREENQGALLARGGAYFKRLTLDSFTGLATDFNEKDEPILLGVRPTGQRIRIEAMSDGTRDQLYLSLRLSSLEKYLEASEPMPFIVDDILVNFDDQRAAATLGALAELSKKIQVLFFTHHRRLVELAQGVADQGQVSVLNLVSEH
ncbi:MAG: AAA family ATPase [Syntrophobacteraceae bacterium]